MPNLRSYTREALLALPAEAELDELVHGVLGKIGYAPQYSRDVGLVGVMLVKLREKCKRYELFQGDIQPCYITFWYSTPPKLDKYKDVIDESRHSVYRTDLPHVCALSLVLAAWEKEPK